MDKKVIHDMMRFIEIKEVIENKEFLKLGNYIHHGKQTRLDHCINVAIITFVICRKKNYDFISATRGALLHDFFFYNWLREGPRLHGFKHPKIAYNNAKEIYQLNSIEKDSILKHMWPLTPVPPIYKESLIVCWADKAVTINDYKSSVLRKKMINLSLEFV